MNKDLIAARFRRSLATYECAAVVQRHMAEALCSRMQARFSAGRIASLLEIGCGSGVCSRLLAEHFAIGHFVLNDLVSEAESTCRSLHLSQAEFLAGDIESVNLPERLSAVVANASLQWVVQVERLLRRIAEALEPGGWFMFTTFLPGHFIEIEQASGGVALAYDGVDRWRCRFADTEQLEAFEAIELPEERLFFDSVDEVLHHLRATGVTGVRQNSIWTRGDLALFTRNYQALCVGENPSTLRYPLTYKPLLLAARKKKQ